MILSAFFALAIWQTRVLKTQSCICVYVLSYFSNGIDVRPILGCDTHGQLSPEWCYVRQTCLDSVASVAYPGAHWIECHHPPAPPPQPHACIDDPLYVSQWHQQRISSPAAWSLAQPNTPGFNVTVVVVDDGVQITHPDLRDNIGAPNYAWNATGHRTPHVKVTSPHGTACAGIIAAVANNQKGGCGISYGATLLSANLLGETFQIYDSAEADVIDTYTNIADVYSNSWGPPDNLAPAFMGPEAYSALERVRTNGRNGKGGIVVFAAGNGGPNDNANFDPYCSHEYTICVGSIGDDDQKTAYSEPGACILVVAPSGGGLNSIITTDLINEFGYSYTNMTYAFSGTSASTPIVSAVVALVLQANSSLTWRDVQGVLAHSTRRNDPLHPDWRQNGAGLWVNEWYGFGAIDAKLAIETAKTWPGMPEMTQIYPNPGAVYGTPLPWNATVFVEESLSLERVSLLYDVSHSWKGFVRVRLRSPSNTWSLMTSYFNALPGANRNLSDARSVPTAASSTLFREENSHGEWLIVIDILQGSEMGSILKVNMSMNGVNWYNSNLSTIQGSPPSNHPPNSSHTSQPPLPSSPSIQSTDFPPPPIPLPIPSTAPLVPPSPPSPSTQSIPIKNIVLILLCILIVVSSCGSLVLCMGQRYSHLFNST
jgi:subtilisin-like proprotein convertase family protein